MPVLSTFGAASLSTFRLYKQSAPGPAPGPSFFAATGGTVTTDGDYKYHTFTSSGTFTVTSGGLADFLVVGGGGSGGGNGSGGGGGGVVIRTAEQLSTGSYSVVIGTGGIKGSVSPEDDTVRDGKNSSFIGVVALGGGGGGYSRTVTGDRVSETYGRPGGSGGGAGIVFASLSYAGLPGAGLQPTSASGGYGNAGGVGEYTPPTNSIFGAPGGGAGGVGTAVAAGPGISGSPLSSRVFGAGGFINAPDANSGNGSRENGDSGIVIIRYVYQ